MEKVDFGVFFGSLYNCVPVIKGVCDYNFTAFVYKSVNNSPNLFRRNIFSAGYRKVKLTGGFKKSVIVRLVPAFVVFRTYKNEPYRSSLLSYFRVLFVCGN